MAKHSLQRRQYERTLNDEEFFGYIIGTVLNKWGISEKDENSVNELIDCFRYLRNRLGSQQSSLQPLLDHAQELCDYIGHMIQKYEASTEASLVLHRIAVQFLGNAVTAKETADVFRKALWRDSSSAQFLASLLNYSDRKVRASGSMVVYNCLFDTRIRELVVEFMEVADALFQSSTFDNEWIEFIVQTLLAGENSFLETYFQKSYPKGRMNAVRAATDMVAAGDDSNMLSERNCAAIAEAYVDDSARLVLDWPVQGVEMELVAAQLEFLCQVTSTENRFQSVRDNEGVLDASLTMLQLSCQYRNSDTVGLNALEALSKPDDARAQRPTYQFRGNLVRLLANLCYEHPGNQRSVGERDGIPLILDCTPLDAENPFITQWCVFAIKNLTDGCPENQRLIKSLVSQGYVVNGDCLRFAQFGATSEQNKENENFEDANGKREMD